MEDLEKIVTALFTEVSNKEVKVPDLSKPPAYTAENLGHLFRFVPVKDKDILSFVWHLPSTDKEYEK